MKGLLYSKFNWTYCGSFKRQYDRGRKEIWRIYLGLAVCSQQTGCTGDLDVVTLHENKSPVSDASILAQGAAW